MVISPNLHSSFSAQTLRGLDDFSLILFKSDAYKQKKETKKASEFPQRPLILFFNYEFLESYSHSMVAGGLPDTS